MRPRTAVLHRPYLGQSFWKWHAQFCGPSQVVPKLTGQTGFFRTQMARPALILPKCLLDRSQVRVMFFHSAVIPHRLDQRRMVRCRSDLGIRRWSCLRIEIYALGCLAGGIDRPVVDRTGLKGRFDFTLELPGFRLFPPLPGTPNSENSPSDPQETLLSAMRKQLGLQLVSSRGAIGTLIVDHVESPSGN
jgi:hypothetical protein